MRALPIALACGLSVVTATYADTETASMSTSESTSTAASKPPESSVKPKTYMHTEDSANTSNKMSQNIMTSSAAKAMSSTDCLITVRNDGITDMVVYGRFDDDTYLTTYTLPWLGDYISYVSLYYYGYCHGGMDFYIETSSGTYKYNGYTPVGKTVRVK